MYRFRAMPALALLTALWLMSCVPSPALTSAPSTTPATSQPQATRTPKSIPSLTPGLSISATEGPLEELAPIGPYEVISRDGQATLHVWVEFRENCLEAGKPMLVRKAMTLEVTISMERSPGIVCMQEASPDEVYLPLDTSTLPPGIYSIVINGDKSHSLAWELASSTTMPPENCPIPSNETSLFIASGDYCVLYPADWHATPEGYRSPLLTGGSHPLTVSLQFIATEASGQHTLEQVVDSALAEMIGSSDQPLEKTVIKLGGEPAILVKNIPGLDEYYRWWVIHYGLVYQGTLGPRDGSPSKQYFDRALDLFLHSLTWLDQ